MVKKSKNWEELFRLGIQKLREKDSLTQKDLAKLSGVPRGTINYFFKEKRSLTSHNQWRLAELFGLTPEEVMDIAAGDLPPPKPDKAVSKICESKQKYRSPKVLRILKMAEQFDEAGDDDALDALFKYAESGAKEDIEASVKDRLKLLEDHVDYLLAKDREFKQVKKTG